MSVVALNWAESVLETTSGLTPRDRLALLYMAKKADEEGSCWVGVAKLAGVVCCHARSVSRITSRLVKLNLLTKAYRYYGDRQTSNLYTLNLDLVPGDTPRQGDDTSVRGGMTSVSGGGCQQRHPNKQSNKRMNRPKEVPSISNLQEIGKAPIKPQEGTSPRGSTPTPPRRKLVDPTTPKGVVLRFFRRRGEEFPECKFIPSPTGKELGLAKNLIKQFEGCQEVVDLIDFIVPKWARFCEYVLSAQGLDKTPAIPSFEFFAYNATHAVNFRTKGMQSIAPQQKEPIVPDLPDGAMTEEEYLAFLDSIPEVSEKDIQELGGDSNDGYGSG